MLVRSVAVVAGLLLLLIGTSPHSRVSSANSTPGNESRATLPSSLDLLYPPRAEAPLLMRSMHGMNAALTGILVDLFQEDWAGVDANFSAFESSFRETSNLVPEWTQRFDGEPVARLGNAVKNREKEAVFGAVESVGAVCHACHVEAMVPVQQKYHWPDFADLTLQDPVFGEDMSYLRFMQMLNLSLTGIGVDLQQGQVENARSHLASFRQRVGELANSCDGCHDTPRAYFVDVRILDLITQMEAALDGPDPDASEVGRLGQSIGQQSCTGCHLVHLPAAYARAMTH